MGPRLSAVTRSGISGPGVYSLSSTQGFWITDQLLRDCFDRFASITLATKTKRHSFDRSHVRHGSNIPGPLEARRRLARRSLNNLSQTSQANIGPSSLENSFMLSKPSYLWCQSPLPRTVWLPPLPIAPWTQSTSSPEPSWMTPLEPPNLEPSQSNRKSTFRSRFEQPYATAQKLSINQYVECLSLCKTLEQLQQLHVRLANTTLETAFCSFLAFEHLLSISSNNVMGLNREHLVSSHHLIDFLLDHRLEHTRGANLARLVDYVLETEGSDTHLNLLVTLLKNGITHDLFSLQALGALYHSLGKLQLHTQGPNCSVNIEGLQKDIVALYLQKLPFCDEILPPTSADLENLVRLTSDIRVSNHVAESVRFILNRASYGLLSGHVTFYQLPSVLYKLQPLVKDSTDSLPSKSIVSIIKEVLELKTQYSFPSETEAELFKSLLAIANCLHVSSSTMDLTADLIRDQAEHGSLTSLEGASLDTQTALTQSALNFLLFDKIQPQGEPASETSNATHVSSLTAFLNSLPSDLAASWFSSSSKIILNVIRRNKESQSLDILNSWLIATFKSNAERYANSKTWALVLEDLSQLVTPQQLTGFFSSLGVELQCRILLRFWIRRDYERQFAPRDTIISSSKENSLTKNTSDETKHFASAPALKMRTYAANNMVDRSEPFDPATTCSIEPQATTQLSLHDLTRLHDGALAQKGVQIDLQDVQQTNPTLESRYARVTTSSLELVFDYLKISSKLYNLDCSDSHLSTYFLRAFKFLRLEVRGPLIRLMKLAYGCGRPVMLDSLVSFATEDPDFRPTRAVQEIAGRQIAKCSHRYPGLALGLFKKIRDLPHHCYEEFLTGIITSPRSRVHPNEILRVVLLHEPGCRSQDSKFRLLRGRNGPLSHRRVDLIHESALMFAGAARFDSWISWRYTRKCLEFLESHGARLDQRMSKAIVQSGLTRALTDPRADCLPKDAMDICHRVVKQLEGERIADLVMKTASLWADARWGPRHLVN